MQVINEAGSRPIKAWVGSKIGPTRFSRTEDANGNVVIVDYSEKVDLSPPMEPVAWMMRWTSNHAPSLTLDPSDYALERHRLIPLYEHPPTSVKCASCCADLYGALQLIAYCKEYLRADPSTVGGRPEAEYLVEHIDAYMARRKSPEHLPAMADIEPPPYDLARLRERFAASNGEDKQKDDDKCPSCNVRYGWHDITCQAITASNW